MSELERSAQPLLEPLVLGTTETRRGKPWRWAAWRKSIAATWALKTAMMLEHADTEDQRTIPKRLYSAFYGFQRPPLTCQIWVAQYVGDDPTHHGRGALDAVEVIGPEGPVDATDAEPYVVALSAGQLAFRLVGHLVVGAGLEQPLDAIAPALARIWPITRQSPVAEWPPQRALDNDGMRQLVFLLRDAKPSPLTNPDGGRE